VDLSLNTVQPKLMQREQTLKLQAKSKTPQADSADEEQTLAFACSKGEVSWELRCRQACMKGGSRELRASSDPRSCNGCGKTGHIKLNCRFRNADCENYGKRRHIRVVCEHPAERSERAVYAKGCAGVAFIVWEEGAGAQTSVWLVDFGNTDYTTGDRSMFTSYKKLRHPKAIKGIAESP
jgi:hypothetical protein